MPWKVQFENGNFVTDLFEVLFKKRKKEKLQDGLLLPVYKTTSKFLQNWKFLTTVNNILIVVFISYKYLICLYPINKY